MQRAEKISNSQQGLPISAVARRVALAVGGLTAVACGPVYVADDPYYGRGYYGAAPAPAAAPASPAPMGSPAAQPDPYFGDLSSYGAWVTTAEYGRVWVPYANRNAGWRPYFQGRWVYSSYGWTWVSEEYWGVTYHYGRWAWMAGYGWAWVPGYTWAPAWVVWRHGGGCVGWAPMGPDYMVGSGYGHVHHSYWVFVRHEHWVDQPVQHVVVASTDVQRVYNQTVEIQNSDRIRGHDGAAEPYDRGPPAEQAQEWTRRPITPQGIESVPNARPRAIPADAPAPRRPSATPSRPAPQPQPQRVPDGGEYTPERGSPAPGAAPERAGGAGGISEPVRPTPLPPGREAPAAEPGRGTAPGREAPAAEPGRGTEPGREAPGAEPSRPSEPSRPADPRGAPPAATPPARTPPPAVEPPADRRTPMPPPPARETPRRPDPEAPPERTTPLPPSGREPMPAPREPAREPPAAREPPPVRETPSRPVAPPPSHEERVQPLPPSARGNPGPTVYTPPARPSQPSSPPPAKKRDPAPPAPAPAPAPRPSRPSSGSEGRAGGR